MSLFVLFPNDIGCQGIKRVGQETPNRPGDYFSLIVTALLCLLFLALIMKIIADLQENFISNKVGLMICLFSASFV